jgi:hypothetical protein
MKPPAVVEWSMQRVTSSSASMPLSLVELAATPLALPLTLLSSGTASESSSASHLCKAIATVGGDGKVIEFEYSGNSSSLLGENTYCWDLVRACYPRVRAALVAAPVVQEK